MPETALIEGKGPFDMELSGEGVKAAHELGAHLKERNVKHIFCSNFKRALHTAVLVSNDVGLSKVNIEEGITEWQSPGLIGGQTPYKPPSVIHLLERFPEINARYESITKPEPFETEQEMVERTGRVARILADSLFPSSILIVSHAPCNIGISLSFEGLGEGRRSESKVRPWPLGGLTQFTRNAISSPWSMIKSGSTDHLSGTWKEGRQAWTLPSLR